MFPFWTPARNFVVVSKLMGPSVQITAHIITLNGSDSANSRSSLRSNQQELTPPLSTNMGWRIECRKFSSNWQYSYSVMALNVYRRWQTSSLQTATFCSNTVHCCSVPSFVQFCLFILFLSTYFEMLSNSGYRYLFLYFHLRKW